MLYYHTAAAPPVSGFIICPLVGHSFFFSSSFRHILFPLVVAYYDTVLFLLRFFFFLLRKSQHCSPIRTCTVGTVCSELRRSSDTHTSHNTRERRGRGQQKMQQQQQQHRNCVVPFSYCVVPTHSLLLCCAW